jgi:hypothetical protein
MNAPAYSVLTTAHFDRLLKKLAPGILSLWSGLKRRLRFSRWTRTTRASKYPIKKLQGVAAGRRPVPAALGRFRFRYDIEEREVVLLYCGLRREDTY